MVKLSGTFSRFQAIKALVIGDFMLDKYTEGEVSRISPEAPVTILHAKKEQKKPGGAGNVVANLLALGANVVAVGRVGFDKEGKILKEKLKEQGADIENIFVH